MNKSEMAHDISLSDSVASPERYMQNKIATSSVKFIVKLQQDQ